MTKALLIFASIITLAAGCSSAVTTQPQPQNQTVPTATQTPNSLTPSTDETNNAGDDNTPDYYKPPYCDKLGNGPEGCIQPPIK